MGSTPLPRPRPMPLKGEGKHEKVRRSRPSPGIIAKTNYRKERKVLKVKNYEPSFYLRRCRGRLGQEPGAKKILEVL
jgi:hypothetical protein